MAEIGGILISDLRPNGTVRISIITGEGSGNEPALEVKDLDTAEANFVSTFGLTPELAATLRRGLERNTLSCLEISLPEEFAAMYCSRDRSPN